MSQSFLFFNEYVLDWFSSFINYSPFHEENHDLSPLENVF